MFPSPGFATCSAPGPWQDSHCTSRRPSVAATLRDLGPWSASLQWRYLGSGALIDDNTVRSRPSSTLNARISRVLIGWGRNAELTLDIFNLTNRRVNDIQYFYESRLQGEAQAVAVRQAA